ncbi:T6SS phospholipase effector Tle1-like catalytic domain-containing protein [Pseudoxanthomonas mexicana]|uniref:T6SS phospholipase effector Tle1-like catalytic domain-containing protein n=1 Tax=Pseudoxanthomonas mexicana TaxID=128785 RepID=UPI00398B5D11
MEFRPGWYLIRTETGGPNEGRQHFRHYVDQQRYNVQCYIEPNGMQILQWFADEPERYKKAPWSSEYKPLREAAAGDWWDNPETSARANPDVPGEYSREQRQPTARELAQRASHADPACADGLACSKEIHVGVFFDGTNNNMDRDRPLVGHSNIVSLYDAHPDDGDTRFRYYIPGVGTPFRQVGEMAEDKDGKTFARGGEARIHWAMLLVYNAVCRASTGSDLMQEAEMTPLVTTYSGLKTKWRFGDDKMRIIFDGIQQRLLKAIKGRRPKVVRLNLSVFGFSRGAAQARTFCNWLQIVTQGVVGHAHLEIRFLGLFDTVASVGFADSSPVGRGLMDWADGTMGVSNVRRGLHYVAAHEIRRSFPVSIARATKGGVVTGISEYIYPGAHSDIGGGYSPGDQGKSMDGRSHLLSQIALNDMHFEAINAGSELLRKAELEARIRADFTVSSELDADFSSYTRWTAVEEKAEDVASQVMAHVESRMQYHMQLYWRWRASKQADDAFKAMSSYQNAGAQDRVDLWESELDWRNDVARARQAHQPTTRLAGSRVGVREVSVPATPSAIQRQIVAEVNAAGNVPANVDRFFDRYPHDSHAGFWLLGPQTQYDKNAFVNEIRNKQEMHDQLMQRSRKSEEDGDYDLSVSYSAQASQYKLNNFERRVLQQNPHVFDERNPASIPLMTDADADDLRGNAGAVTSFALTKLMGTATRREAGGHGQYRRVFDKS